jgi:hypothetical protein
VFQGRSSPSQRHDEEDAAGPSLVEMLGNKNQGGGDAGNDDDEDSGAPEMDVWIKILRTVIPADDSAFYEDSDGEDEDLYTATTTTTTVAAPEARRMTMMRLRIAMKFPHQF